MTLRRGVRAALTGAAIAAMAAGAAVTGLATPVDAATSPTIDPYASVAYQHDPAHDGHSVDPGFVAPLTTSWSTTLGDTVIGSPLIADGRVFVTVGDPQSGVDVEALSLATGHVLWGPTQLGGPFRLGSIAYDAGRVFGINFDGELTAFDAATGSVDWTSQLPGQWAFTGAPTAVDGVVYVGGAGSGGTLYAVDETWGTTTWTAPVMNGDDSSPAVDATGVYVSYGCEQAYRFSHAGALTWHHSTDCEGGGGNTPVLHDGRVYVRDIVDPPAVLDGATGDQLATFAADVDPAFDAAHMATVSDGILMVTDPSTGERIWRSPAGDSVTAPLIANGYVIEGRRNGTVEARDVQDGRLAWSYDTGTDLTGSNLAEGDGALVVPAGATLTTFVPRSTRVKITGGPTSGSVVGRRVTFSFSAPAGNVEYLCTLDGVTASCTSPITYTGLAAGKHVFSAAVADAAAGGETRTFRVDTLAPSVRLSRFRPMVTHRATATAHWSATDDLSGVRAYQLRVRQAAAGVTLPAWSTHAPTTSLSRSLHLHRDSRLCVSVRAQDRAGNWSTWSTAQCVRRLPARH